jgi:cobalt-zinc-cadmium efflux system protein
MAHVLTDLYASIAAAVSGLVIVLTDIYEVDGIAALVVAALMVSSGWRLLRDSSRVLLEAAPSGVDPQAVGMALASQPGVVEVHDLHVWEVTSGFNAVAAHVVVAPDDDCHGRRRELQAVLHDQFGIDHTTLQVDHATAPQILHIGVRSTNPPSSPAPGDPPSAS